MAVYFPFNSVMVNGQPDRPANAETLAQYLKTFFTDGVVLHDSTSLQVNAKEDLTVQIQPGTAFLDGRIFYNETSTDIILDDAEINLDRIDRIIYRIDYVNRLMEFAVLKGEPGSEPVATELQRDADAWEMCLAEIKISALATEITQAEITDTRADVDLCGYADLEKAGFVGLNEELSELESLVERIEEATPAYTYGTNDLTAGKSALETGKLYFVYE